MWMICIVQDLKFLVISLQLPNITRVVLLSFEQLVAHEQVQRTHLQSSRCVCVCGSTRSRHAGGEGTRAQGELGVDAYTHTRAPHVHSPPPQTCTAQHTHTHTQYPHTPATAASAYTSTSMLDVFVVFRFLVVIRHVFCVCTHGGF